MSMDSYYSIERDDVIPASTRDPLMRAMAAVGSGAGVAIAHGASAVARILSSSQNNTPRYAIDDDTRSQPTTARTPPADRITTARTPSPDAAEVSDASIKKTFQFPSPNLIKREESRSVSPRSHKQTNQASGEINGNSSRFHRSSNIPVIQGGGGKSKQSSERNTSPGHRATPTGRPGSSSCGIHLPC